MFETTYSETFDVSSLSSITIVNTPFEVEVEIENQTLNCKISSEHQIQTLRFVGHLRPGWTIEPRPKWPMGGHLSLTQMAISHLRHWSFESNAMYILLMWTILIRNLLM